MEKDKEISEYTIEALEKHLDYIIDRIKQIYIRGDIKNPMSLGELQALEKVRNGIYDKCQSLRLTLR